METNTENARDNKTETFSKQKLIQLLKLGKEIEDEFEERGIEVDTSEFEDIGFTPVIDHRRDHERGVLALMNSLGNAGEQSETTAETPLTS